MKFSEATRKVIYKRANGRCEVCGLPWQIAQIHHRRPRGMGGTSRKNSGTASNGLLVHPKCHARIESQREIALENGWLVSQTADPLVVPVKLWHGVVLLDDNGGSHVKEVLDSDRLKGIPDPK